MRKISSAVIRFYFTNLLHENFYVLFKTRAERERSTSVLYLIKHELRVFKMAEKRPIVRVHWRSNFKSKRCLSRENQS